MLRHRSAGFVAAASGRRSRRFLSSPGLDFLLNPTPEHASLRDMVKNFAQQHVAPQAEHADAAAKFNPELFRMLGKLGLLGITVPETDGGAGMDATAAVIAHHELSRYDPGFCLAYLAHAMLFVNNFCYSANAEQKNRFLPDVISGEKIAAMGMSEPDAGTDVVGMRTTATVNERGNYVLNGGKIWITNGSVADVFFIYAKVNGKITAFVVEKNTKGFTTGPNIEKCGMRASTMCQLFFDNVEVPKENLVGEEGKGIVHMMRNLEIERLTLAAMAVGIADECLLLMMKYAQQRKAFGKHLTAFGQIQRFIAESFADTEAAKCLTYAVSRSVAPGVQNRVGSDAAKLFAAPVGKRVADNAMQVLGGLGYTRGAPIERLWRDAKLLEIGGGTLEAHHKNLVKDLAQQL